MKGVTVGWRVGYLPLIAFPIPGLGICGPIFLIVGAIANASSSKQEVLKARNLKR